MRTRTSFLNFKDAFRDFSVFSTSDIAKVFPQLHRRRLHEWNEKGLLKRVLKGYYIFADAKVDENLLYFIANRIYNPSYISLHSALGWHGLIPEFVPQITSVSTRKTTKLNTKFGTFAYFSIKEALMFGYDLTPFMGGLHRIKIAYPEKALLDLLYLNSRIASKEHLAELRINREVFKEKVNLARLKEYLKLFENNAFTARVINLIDHMEVNNA